MSDLGGLKGPRAGVDQKGVADHYSEHLLPLLRGLAAGADPSQVLRSVVTALLAATRATEAAVVRASGKSVVPVAASRELSKVTLECAEAAVETGRLVRKRDADTGATAAAEPLRGGDRVVGAVVVGGNIQHLDPAALPVYASAASLALVRQGTAAPGRLAEVLDRLSVIGADLDARTMLGKIFDVAHDLFGAASGLCALFDKGVTRIAHYRGIPHDQLVAVTEHPGFKALITATALRVEPHAHPVVSQLARLNEIAVSLPLEAGGQRLGQLVLLVSSPPDEERRALMNSFARHAALCLRSADLVRSIADHEEQLTSMVHSMAHPVVVVDEDGRLVEVNGAASQLFRLPTNIEDRQPVAGRLGSKALEAMLTSGDDRTEEVVLGTEEQRVYRATVRRIRSSTGRPTGRILVLDDLTTEREVTALKNDFVAVIGHELRTPLTVMKGYLHTLIRRSETLTGEKREQALTALKSNVTRLEQLVEDLLFMSAIEQRRFKLDVDVHDLSSILDARESDRVVVRRPRWPVKIEVDQGKLDQVLHHLLDNALKYSEGQVIVELAEKPEAFEISVTDSGPGIFSGDIPHLFERFKQLDASSTRAHGGLGIGLYICKRLVEAMGGGIWCESRLGVGSRFAFTLPKEGPRAAEAGTQGRSDHTSA